MKFNIQNLPQSPGVYMYYNKSGSLLYVGKAKKLKNRVQSYFRKNADLTPAKQIMVQSIERIEHILTDTETEALLLETNLIKKYKPPYNILLKDDKDWQYIVIDYSKIWPELLIVRRPQLKRTSQIKAFGPYLSGIAVKDTVRLIKKIFHVCLNPPQKKNGHRVQRSFSRGGCFYYHINRCLGPCVGAISKTEYTKMFKGIEAFLRGDRKTLVTKLKHDMHDLSTKKCFESAARMRDQLQALTKLDQKQKMVLTSSDTADIASIYRINNKGALNIFRVREGKVVGKFTMRFSAQEFLTDAEVLSELLDKYYQSTEDIPNEIISTIPISTRSINNIPILVTKHGKKAKLVSLGETNAKHTLEQTELTLTKGEASPEHQLVALQKALKIQKPINRIETYDISNIQGSFAVGAMVVSVGGIQKNNHYRIFGIKSKTTPDDPFMMYETLTRRLAHINSKPSQDESLTSVPDLIVIDGGKTQLNSAVRALTEAGLDIPVISLAKKQEEIFIPNRKNPLTLLKTNPALKLIQRGRNEAHRFGITRYRKKHGKSLVTSMLNDIPKIGPKTSKALIKSFGSIEGISNASHEDIKKVIGSKKADIIKEYL